MSDPFDPIVTIEEIYRAWQRAERRYLSAAPGTAEADEALKAVTQLWEWYEDELGRVIARGMLPALEA